MKNRWFRNLVAAVAVAVMVLSTLYGVLPVFASHTIDVGPPAIDGDEQSSNGNTYIDVGNPANASGTLTKVELFANIDLTNCKVGVFYTDSSNYKCRSTATIGSVTDGSKQTFNVSLSIQSGDFIGLYFDGGYLERQSSGGQARYTSGDHCVVNDTTSYTTSTKLYSIHGYAEAAAPTVSSISPDYGSTAGSTSVTITGSGFTGASGATIGGSVVTSFSVVGDTSITGVSPSGTVGARDVVVTNGGQTGTLTGGFKYVAPVTNTSIIVEQSAATAHSNHFVRIALQKKVFVAAGRTWAFFERHVTTDNMYFSSSTDGVTWATPTLIAASYSDYEFASYWDGTTITVAYAKQDLNAHIYYRRGTPVSDGTITWDTTATDIYTPASGGTPEDLSVCVNTSGYAFIGFADASLNEGRVIKNAKNDGDWTQDSDTALSTVGARAVSFAVLTSGKVYACYAAITGGAIKGKLWNAGWGSEEADITSTLGGYFDSWTSVGIGDDVHIAYSEETTNHVEYRKRTYGVGWGSVTELSTTVVGYTLPIICANGTNLAVFWADNAKIYVKNYISGSWDADPTTVADETSNVIYHAGSINSVVNATSNVFGIIYDIGLTTWPYFTKYASYTQSSSPSTITLSAATSKEATTATLNGNITATGGENPSVTVYWGTTDHPGTATGWDHNSVPTSPSQPQGIAAFYVSATSLETGTTIYFTAKATNSGGTAWPAASLSFLTKPAAPTNVAATDGSETSKVVITWTKSTGATDYHVWRDAVDLGAAGDVATLDDTGADASVITQGSSVAGDGSSTAHVALSLSGTSIANGTSYTYKVVASNATGNSADSATDTGYRGHGTLQYQWQMSAGDSDASYSDIVGATASTYNATEAPAPTVTQGTASATDGFYTDKVRLSISGASANIGAGRYFQCNLTATGCVNKTATANRGYRGVGSLTYQWKRSDANSDQDFNTNLGTTDPYDDVTAPAPSITKGTASAEDGGSINHVTLSLAGESANNGQARYYYCVVSATGAVSQDTNHNQGYIGVGTLTLQWQRSLADSDADYSNINLATTDPYDDVGGVVDPDGRYYRCVLNATGASQQITDGNRGYMAGSGWTGTINGVADPSKVMGIDGANINKVIGQ